MMMMKRMMIFLKSIKKDPLIEKKKDKSIEEDDLFS